MKKAILICIVILGLCLITISKWEDIKTFFVQPQTKPVKTVIAQEDLRLKEEMEIKKVLVKEFSPNIDFNNSKYEIRIIRDWSFGHVNGKGFVLRKVNNKWELVPYAKWDQLIDQMPEDIRLKWGEYMNPGE